MGPDRKSNVDRAPDEPDKKISEEGVVEPNDTATVTASFIHDEGGYKVYKRRFFGLAQLVLLNIVVSWDVRCPRLLGRVA